MKLFKRNKRLEEIYDIDDIIDESRDDKTEEEDDKFDPNCLEHVIDRVEGGLIGSLRIESDINYPLFKPGDICHLRAPQRILKGDIVLYKDYDEYYLRRIIKYKDDGMYVAGDDETAYHIIHKEDIVAKAIARERGSDYLSLVLEQRKKFYNFIKLKLAAIRLGNRVIEHEQDVNIEAYEAAMAAVAEQEEINDFKAELTLEELEADLSGFRDPNELVRELNKNKPIDEIMEEKKPIEDSQEYDNNDDVIINDDSDIDLADDEALEDLDEDAQLEEEAPRDSTPSEDSIEDDRDNINPDQNEA